MLCIRWHQRRCRPSPPSPIPRPSFSAPGVFSSAPRSAPFVVRLGQVAAAGDEIQAGACVALCCSVPGGWPPQGPSSRLAAAPLSPGCSQLSRAAAPRLAVGPRPQSGREEEQCLRDRQYRWEWVGRERNAGIHSPRPQSGPGEGSVPGGLGSYREYTDAEMQPGQLIFGNNKALVIWPEIRS